MAAELEIENLGDEELEDRDYDSFFLGHLQSIQGNSAWYLNQRFIGKGGNGTTFFVTCTSGVNYGVQFALKVFHKISDEKRRARFLDEVRHYKNLSHPSIIKIYDEGTFKAGSASIRLPLLITCPKTWNRGLDGVACRLVEFRRFVTS